MVAACIQPETSQESQIPMEPVINEQQAVEVFEVVYRNAKTTRTEVILRCIVTDVLYVRASGAGTGTGLTVMLHPEGGRPLTYTEYLEMAERNN